MRPVYWIPPLAWMGVILWFSSGDFSATETGVVLGPLLLWLFPWAAPGEIALLHGTVRKLAHLTVYAVLALLWYRAFTRGRPLPRPRAALISLVITVAWACVDELHQSMRPTRTGAMSDVGIDSLGAIVALMAAYPGRRTLTLLTRVFVWIAALGGTAFLAINWTAGVDSGPLWATTPAAWLVLALGWRRVLADRGAGPV